MDLDLIDDRILSGALCLPLGLYDHTRLDVTGLVAAGATSATLEIQAVGDCHSIAAVALVVDTVPGTGLPEPSALDRDPLAVPLTVARSPAGLQLRWEDLGGGAIYDAYRGSICA